MGRRRSSSTARRARGVIPSLGSAVGTGLRWLCHHPQPLLLLGILAGVGGWLWTFLPRSDAFLITAVQVWPNNSPVSPPETLMGRNLWAVDVHRLAGQLHGQRPSLKEVQVVRVLPGTLRILVVEREPKAQVRVGRWYPVDGDGYVLPQGSEKPADELIALKGLDAAGTDKMKVGVVNDGDRLQLALRVASTLQRAPALRGRRIATLDVSNPKQISFVLGENVEVRCGSEAELPRHLERLRAVFRTAVTEPEAVRYIDLRFNEPVISPRASDLG